MAQLGGRIGVAIPNIGGVGVKLFGWFKHKGADSDPLLAWRARWAQSIDDETGAAVAALRGELDRVSATGIDTEVEQEMLDALEQLNSLRADCRTGALPVLHTQHRAVGTEVCHLMAPVSLPDDPSQAFGRLLATPTRAVFVGAGRTLATAWHTVHQVIRSDRDLLFLRADQTPLAHYRFNTFADALMTAHLARHFNEARRGRL